jgi:hypothetical protein
MWARALLTPESAIQDLADGPPYYPFEAQKLTKGDSSHRSLKLKFLGNFKTSENLQHRLQSLFIGQSEYYFSELHEERPL